MKQPSTLLGFSIAPTRVNAVRLSPKQFTIETQLEKTLPPAIVSHDGKKLLDHPTLLALL